MKKGLIIVLTIAMLFGIVACNQEEPVVDVAGISAPEVISVYTDYTKDIDGKLVMAIDGKDPVEIQELSTISLGAYAYPEIASNKGLKYESSDESKVYVDANGTLHFSTGYSKDLHTYEVITIKSDMNPSIVKYCYICVNYEVPTEGSIKLYDVDGTTDLSGDSVHKDFVSKKTEAVTYTPVIVLADKYNMSNKLSDIFTFESSNKDIATVSEEGVVSINTKDNSGTTVITVKSKVPYVVTEDNVKKAKFASASYEVNVNVARDAASLTTLLSDGHENITLYDNCSLAELCFIPEDKTVTLNLNGYKINNDPTRGSSVYFALISVKKGAILTIKDDSVSGTGTIYNASDAMRLINVVTGGTLNIEGGKYSLYSSYDGDIYGICVGKGGKLTLKNATIDVKQSNTGTSANAFGVCDMNDDTNLEIAGGNNITVTGSKHVYGVYGKYGVTINDTVINLVGGTEAIGVHSDGAIEATKTIVNLKGTITNAKPFATVGKVTLKNSEAYSAGDAAITNIYAIATGNGGLDIDGGNFKLVADKIEFAATAGAADLNGKTSKLTVDISAADAQLVAAYGITVDGGTYKVAGSTKAAAFTDYGTGDSVITDANVDVTSTAGDATLYNVKTFVGNPSSITINRGRMNVEAKGKAEAKGNAYTFVKNGSYLANPITFNDAVVNAKSEEGDTRVVMSNNKVTVNGGTLSANCVDAYVFYLRNGANLEVNNAKLEAKGATSAYIVDANNATVEFTKAKATAETTGTTNTEKAFIVNALNSVVNVAGGTYKATADDEATLFFLKEEASFWHEANKESSIVVDSSISSVAEAKKAVAIETDGIKSLKSVGGYFTVTGKSKAKGISLNDTNMVDTSSTTHVENGILKNTNIVVKATEGDAEGLAIVLDSQKFAKTLNAGINEGFKLSVTAKHEAYGVVIKNKKAVALADDLIVDWYDGNANVTVNGGTYAVALDNNAELHFNNDKKDNVFVADFAASVKNGLALGILNGTLSEAKMDSLKLKEYILLDTEGLINVDGKAYINFYGSSDDDIKANHQYNYAGTFMTYENGTSVGKKNDGISTANISNNAVTTYSNIALDPANSVVFTMKSSVDGSIVTYRVPENTTWAEFIQNRWLSYNRFTVETSNNSTVAEDRIITNLDYAHADTNPSKPFYVADSTTRNAVDKTDVIKARQYYLSVPFVIITNDGKADKRNTYYVEGGSKWADFVSNYDAFEVAENDSITYTDANDYLYTVVYSNNKNHVEESEYVYYNGEYRFTFTFSLKERMTDEDPLTLEVLQGTSWKDYAVSKSRFSSEDEYAFYNGRGSDNNTYQFYVADASTRKNISNKALIVPGKEYYVATKFSVTSIENSKESTSTYFVERDANWSYFAGLSNTDDYVVDSMEVNDGDVQEVIAVGINTKDSFKKLHVGRVTNDSFLQAYLVKADETIRYNEDYKVVVSFKEYTGLDGDYEGISVLQETTWADLTNNWAYDSYRVTDEFEDNSYVYKYGTSAGYKFNGLYITTNNGKTPVNKASYINAGDIYFLSVRFTIAADGSSNEDFFMKNGSDWEDFVTWKKYSYSLEQKVANQEALTNTSTFKDVSDYYTNNTVTYGLTRGYQHLHVGQKIMGTCFAVNVKYDDKIYNNTAYGVTKNIFMDLGAVEGFKFVSVLNGTTWADVVDDFASAPLPDLPFDKTGLAMAVETIDGLRVDKIKLTLEAAPGQVYYIATGINELADKDDELSADEKYSVALPVDITVYENGSDVVKEYYVTYGTTWNDFALKTLDFTVDGDQIAVGSFKGADKAHVWNKTASAYVTATEDVAITGAEYKTAFHLPLYVDKTEAENDGYYTEYYDVIVNTPIRTSGDNRISIVVSRAFGNDAANRPHPTTLINLYSDYSLTYYSDAEISSGSRYVLNELTPVTSYFSLYTRWEPNVCFNVHYMVGSIEYKTEKYAKGDKIVKPEFAIPVDVAVATPQYTEVVWCKESSCQNAWAFDTDTVTNETYLYAMFREPTRGVATVSSTAGMPNNECEWVQLWAGGPKFATMNVGATAANYKNASADAAHRGGYYKDTEDFASSQWGNNWKTPTASELTNLFSESAGKTVSTYYDGTTNKYEGSLIPGWKISGKDAYAGNSIFIPLNGYGSSDSSDSTKVYLRTSTTSTYAEVTNSSGNPTISTDNNSGFYTNNYLGVRAILNESSPT